MISFTQAESTLHALMHKYFDNETEYYLMFGILLCEWSDESTLKIINSGFPPALTYTWQ
jgi:hypothetical protein